MTGLVEKIKEMWTPNEEFEEEEIIENEHGEKDRKVVSIDGKNTSKLKVVLSRPERFGDEIKNIADELLKSHTVVLNLEVTPKSESRRLVDFLSGIAYAIGGKLKKVSNDTFVITPRNVDIEGEDIVSEFENKGVYF